MIFYTDYPIEELGDILSQLAPIRKVIPISWDENKYVEILVEGEFVEVKAGYIYTEFGRCGDAEVFDVEEYFKGAVK
jgi:hypothetical protein